MKPLLLLAGLCSLLVGSTVSAQVSATASLSSQASVLLPVSLTVTAPLDFGKLSAGMSKTILPDDPTSGRFYFTDDPSQTLYVLVTPPTTLSDGASHTMSVSSTTLTFKYTDTPGGTSGSLYSSFLGVSPMYFRIGATVTAAAGQVGGLYSGNFLITANY
jgi:hypothetical protein